MIVLIGAASCTGKTKLAKELMVKHGMPFYSVDHLKMGIFRSNPNCGFTPLDSNEWIGDKLWPLVKGIIMTAIENEQDLIVEGCYLFPSYLDSMDEIYRKAIVPAFICFSEDYVINHYHDGIIKYRQVAEKREYDEDRDVSVFIQDHMALYRHCEASGFTPYVISEDYEKEMAEIVSKIDNAIVRKRI